MKVAALIALFAIVGTATAAEPVSVKMLQSGTTLTMSDDGHRTYIEMKGAKSTDSGPVVFERDTMDGKHLRNYIIAADGRMVFDGVIRRAVVILDGEKVEFTRS